MGVYKANKRVEIRDYPKGSGKAESPEVILLLQPGDTIEAEDQGDRLKSGVLYNNGSNVYLRKKDFELSPVDTALSLKNRIIPAAPYIGIAVGVGVGLALGRLLKAETGAYIVLVAVGGIVGASVGLNAIGKSLATSLEEEVQSIKDKL